MYTTINERNIAIYGAGYDARMVIRELSFLNVMILFCAAKDNQGGKINCGNGRQIDILSPDTFDRNLHFVIIASRNYSDEMERFLIERQFIPEIDYIVLNIGSNDYDSRIQNLLGNTCKTDSVALCDYLNRYLILTSDNENSLSASFCWLADSNKFKPIVEYKGNVSDFTDEIIALKQLASTSVGATDYCGYCLGCKEKRAVSNYYNEKFQNINIGIYPARCNFKCVYCLASNKRLTVGNNEAMFNIAGMVIQELRNRRLVGPNCVFGFASGEISASGVLRKALFSLAGENAVLIDTNAAVFSNDIAKKISDGVSSILVSLDAGTSETFTKIKGADCFDKVIRNIKKYREYGFVQLKYIMLKGFNDNEQDYDGIIGLLRELGLRELTVAVDENYISGSYSEEVYPIGALVKFLTKLRNSGIHISNNAVSQLPHIYNKKILELTENS